MKKKPEIPASCSKINLIIFNRKAPCPAYTVKNDPDCIGTYCFSRQPSIPCEISLSSSKVISFREEIPFAF